MFNLGQIIPEEILKQKCRSFAIKEISSFSFTLGYENYMDLNFKNLWNDLTDDNVINHIKRANIASEILPVTELNNFCIGELRNEIQEYLFLNSCMMEIYKGCLEGKAFCSDVSKSLSRIKRREINSKPNFNLSRRYKSQSFLFPFDLNTSTNSGTPDNTPMHFEDFFAYVLIGMDKVDKATKVSPVKSYKYSELKITDNNNISENISAFLAFVKKYFAYSNEFKFNIFSNYLFEQEFNHSLTMDIMYNVDSVSELINITKEDKNLIYLTLSFLSLLPLFSKNNFIKLFLKIGYESEKFGWHYAKYDVKPFSKEWSEFCIKNILKLSFISIPVMEQVHYYLMKNNPVHSGGEEYMFITEKDQWYIEWINKNNQSILERNQKLKLSANPIENTKSSKNYYEIQKIISTLKTAFDRNILKDIYANVTSIIKPSIYADEIDMLISKENINLDLDNVLEYIENILNGNMKSAINIMKLDKSKPYQDYLDKQLKASSRIGELLHKEFNKLFYF